MGTSSSQHEEIGRRGEALYQEKIKALVDPKHYGKFVVIDVETVTMK